MLLTATASGCHTKSLTRYHLTNPDSSVAFAEKTSRHRLSLRKTYIFGMEQLWRVAKTWRLFLWGRAAGHIAGFTFLGFRRVERVGNKTHTQSAHRRLLKMRNCIAWSLCVEPVRWYSPSEASAVGDSMFPSRFPGWIFENGTGWSVRVTTQRGNHFKKGIGIYRHPRGAVSSAMFT